KNWSSGGCGIDMVGCYDGCIQNSSFSLFETPGAAGLQAKGGSTNITIRNNVFNHAGGRSIQAGGSTELQYFRRPNPTYEAKDITIEHNVIIGGMSAVAFTGVDGAVVRFNTIYNPTTWVMRILQENTSPGFVPSQGGVFTDNIVVYNSS